MAIVLMFNCGHWVSVDGDNPHPICHCGNDVIVDVDASAPKFRGTCTGPLAKFEDLPAVAVTLKKDH